MDIIEKLTAKTPMCNRQSLIDWWNLDHLTRLPAITEWDDAGCFLISDHSVTYCNFLNGRTYQISNKLAPKNWDLFQKLYILASNQKTLRLDLPIKQNILLINGVEWEYTETIRPGRGNGENIKSIFESEEDMIKEVDEVIKIIKLASQVSQKIPLFRPSLLVHDAVGMYFYTNWGDWQYDVNQVIDANLKFIRSYLNANLGNWHDPDAIYNSIVHRWEDLQNGI
jgi:hypothetical protein